MFGKNKILAVFGLYLICLFGISLYFETTIIPTGTAAILAPYFLFANITFAFIIGFLFLRLFVLEHEKNQKEIQNKNMLLQNAVEEADVRNEEIKTLLRELNHRTKNNLQLISSLLSIQSSRLSDSAAKSALEDSKNRIVSIIMLNQKLYSGNNVSKVSVREYLDDLILHLCALYNGSCDDIKLVIDIDDIYINIDTATALGLLVNELITNSFKHGISGAQTEEISVVLKSQNDSNIELFIMDSGKGIELLNEIHKNNSFGKMLIHSLVKQLNGSIIIGENNNNSARITFPMYKQDFTLNND
jgi:two-component sensor histidine kinase